MNEEKNDKHQFNIFLDKQIQQKLLEANEEVSTKEFKDAQQYNRQIKDSNLIAVRSKTSNNAGGVVGNAPVSSGTGILNQAPQNGSKSLQKSSVKETQAINISGWCPNPGIAFRKVETDVPSNSLKGKGTPNISNKDVSKDFRSRAGGQLQDFVFRHYADTRRYIEQYRREHTCYDTSNSSATKNEFLDTRRFYAYNQYSPLAVSLQSTYQQNSTLPSQQDYNLYQHTMDAKVQQSLQYAKKDQQQKQALNANYRSSNSPNYKFSKPSVYKPESTHVLAPLSENPEGDDVRGRRRGSSAKDRTSPTVNGFAISKNSSSKISRAHTPNSGGLSARATKPSLQSGLLDSSVGNQFVGHRLGQSATGHMRTLDSLANNGQDKQGPWHPIILVI